jgi:hypothetical protein
MTNPARASRRGGGVAALLLAVLFLAVLGGSVGYLVGRQVKAHRAAPVDSQRPPVSTGTPGSSASSPAQDDGGQHCPKISERDSHKSLTQVRYLKTHRSEVWVCRDPDGGYWYQGHNLAGDIDTDKFGILVGDVSKQEGGLYVATNPKDGTQYLIYADKLVIKQNGSTSEEKADQSTG